uniref:F-box domain-containing protein n=1 Tax=Chlamydomonas euryale TaxID=1486919 RepID=A0A7R9YUC8_9CHLO|mmetsp:Transcript_23838/g.70739  ORF Transcript_23838/g.70739 Transcript_23838/m.70739 type:complete len:768 (+) Transcript_23838:488-2791(+)
MIALPHFVPMTPAASLGSSLSGSVQELPIMELGSPGSPASPAPGAQKPGGTAATADGAHNGAGSDDALLHPPFGRSASAPQPCAPADELPDLPDDVLMDVLGRLDGNNRHAVHGTSRRLHNLAHSTFSTIMVPVPHVRSSAAPTREQAATLAAMSAVVAMLPPPDRDEVDVDGDSVAAPGAAAAAAAGGSGSCGGGAPPRRTSLHLFLSSVVAKAPGGKLAVESLRVRPALADVAACQIGYGAMAALGGAARTLRKLSLPAVDRGTAAALRLLPPTLTQLSVTLCDSCVLDEVLALTQLTHLTLSTRKGLLYLMVSQRQVAALAGIAGLQSLSLNRVLLHDCRVTWQPLASLTQLTELQVSSPFSPERLQQLPTSLHTLQAPCFTGGLDAGGGAVAAHLPPSFRLSTLRCRQALSEGELAVLSRLATLTTLQCDSMVLSDAAVAAAYAGLARLATLAAGAGAEAGRQAGQLVARATGLPVLRSVKCLRMTGVHSFNGLLGAVFPRLETLQVASVTVPRALPGGSSCGAAPVALPSLRRLAWPSCRVLPAMLAGCPQLEALVVTEINCLQRLEELLHMQPPAAPPTSAPATPPTSTSPGDAAASAAHDQFVRRTTSGSLPVGIWWPPKLCDLTLGFCSSLRFRPKQVAGAMAAAPDAFAAAIVSLSLRDASRGDGGGDDGPYTAGRLVDDAVLAAAVRRMRCVEALTVTDCGALTASGLAAALGAAPARLASVTVAGCPKVPRAKAERIPCALGRPMLDIRWREVGAV